ncbi:uncharacterized protein MONBRDRAFT_24558 [Monosiga brevicollis MX1]|uniref:Translocon-associated protein subunit delta n=1 Tax=Monosiga brevicollis TaxID=81824 RepID=A9UWT2_MONBE|nr:uncharacterized protein MONBRDRAFT_24558 [Monosiga brevicollis MX1]EDQ90270.1 predicted protein [Monosiga brevicollis MX1]|eukprot:XP_001745037.1 hypothetical protein [Monosiga brevicollis MX1]
MRLVLALAALAAFAAADICSNPDVKSEPSITGSPNMYDQTSYGVKFSVSCNGKRVTEPLTAYVNGQFVPVASSATGDYQVSWFAKNKDMSSGTTVVTFFDAASFQAAEEAAKPVSEADFSIAVPYSVPSAFSLPVPAEFIAMFVLGYLVYFTAKASAASK